MINFCSGVSMMWTHWSQSSQNYCVCVCHGIQHRLLVY